MMKLCFLLLVLNSTLAMRNWELIVEKGKLKIYRATKAKNGVYPIRSDYQADFSLDEIREVLVAVDKKIRWVPTLKKITVLGRKSAMQWVEHALINVPWPCADREIIYEVRQRNFPKEGKIIFDIKSVRDDYPIAKDHIRAHVYKSQIILSKDKAKNKTRTLISTEAFVDPRGSIPKWIVNFFQKEQSLKLAQGLIKELNFQKARKNP